MNNERTEIATRILCAILGQHVDQDSDSGQPYLEPLFCAWNIEERNRAVKHAIALADHFISHLKETP